MPVSGTDRSLPSVPRSKGCVTCVSRKSRCDGRRPTCRACENRKQICRGYRRDDFVFLSDGWRAPGVGTTVCKRRLDATQAAGQPKPQIPGSRAPSGPVAVLVPGLPLHRNLTLDRSSLHVAFFLSEFATPLQAPPFLMHLFRHYMSRLPSPPSYDTGAAATVLPSTPVLFAVEALAQGHFGRVNADPVSTEQSFQNYGMALRAMSAQLAELSAADSGLKNLSEENWQHIAFFCIVMMFWEFKMSPKTQNWQRHIRGLVDTIVLRDSDHAYSTNNYRLLAASRLFIMLQTLSAKQPGRLSSHEWPSIRSAWLKEIQTVTTESESGETQREQGYYHSLDSLMENVSATVPIMAQYDRILARLRDTTLEDNVEAQQSLADLYREAHAILRPIEEELHGRWTTTMSETPLAEWLLSRQAADSLDRDQVWASISHDVHALIDSVFSFKTMRDYHAVSLHWTTVMSLRLLISDILAVLMTVQSRQLLPGDPMAEIEHHCAQLTRYTQKVLQVIPYVQQPNIRTLAPFFLATGFQMATVILERQCRTLRTGGAGEAEIRQCEETQTLIARYMDWVAKSKILIRVDVDPLLHQWKLRRIL